MSIQYVILGFLSQEPHTGYDLKKRFVDSPILYWSGNNNQIYRSLVKLHEEGLVTKEVEHQDDSPDRKIYTINEAGQAALRDWLLQSPELPDLRNHFHIQLMWADQLSEGELDDLLSQYEEEMRVRLLMLQEQARRSNSPRRSAREALLRERINDNWIAYHQLELDWARNLRDKLNNT